MKPLSIMLIAGEASGDLLAAELVRALRSESGAGGASPTTDAQPLRSGLEPRFFGAGGPRMAAVGVDLAFDMTAHAVIGLDALKHLLKFRRLRNQLFQLALRRQPDAIVCVDFGGFNSRFGHAVKAYARTHRDWFHDWDPKLIQFISPQVWASREGRAYKLAGDFDLLLSIFPFEKKWYARRVPGFRVEFIRTHCTQSSQAGRFRCIGTWPRTSDGLRAFEIEDNNGYVLCFGRPVAPTPQ